MGIRRTIQISATISACSVLLVATTFFMLQIMNDRHAMATMHMNAAVRKITLLRGFLLELKDGSNQRAARQW